MFLGHQKWKHVMEHCKSLKTEPHALVWLICNRNFSKSGLGRWTVTEAKPSPNRIILGFTEPKNFSVRYLQFDFVLGAFSQGLLVDLSMFELIKLNFIKFLRFYYCFLYGWQVHRQVVLYTNFCVSLFICADNGWQFIG